MFGSEYAEAGEMLPPAVHELSPEAYGSLIADMAGHTALRLIIEEGLRVFEETDMLPECRPYGQTDIGSRLTHMIMAEQIRAHNQEVVRTHVGEMIPVASRRVQSLPGKGIIWP